MRDRQREGARRQCEGRLSRAASRARYTPGVPIFEPILERLTERGGRFVVVGGLAVVLHGHPRLTVDLDLVVDLEPEAARKSIAALLSLGLRPLAPVDAMDFADREKRHAWIAEKGMRVFSLYDPDDPLRIDLFVEAPLDFERLWSQARRFDLGGLAVPVASIEDLIQMKRQAGGTTAGPGGRRAAVRDRARREGRRAVSDAANRGPVDAMTPAAWELTTWEGNRRWRTARALAATPLERLRWLESALALAHAAGAVARPRRDRSLALPIEPAPRGE